MHFSSKSVGRVIVAAAASLSLLALTGCSSTPDGSSAEPETRTLTIATSNDAPFSYTDTSGTLLGIDGEMITAIAEEKGWEIEVFTTDFNTLISALKANKADVIVDAMYITDERKKQVDFTEPWYTEGEGMLVPADSTITSRDELGGQSNRGPDRHRLRRLRGNSRRLRDEVLRLSGGHHHSGCEQAG